MRIPTKRVRFSYSHEGHVSEAGYLIVDIRGLDIEGATSIVIPMEDVNAARSAGDREEDAKRRARELLGG